MDAVPHRAKPGAGNVVHGAMDPRREPRLHAGMHKKPTIPPKHRPYPRTHPIPVRPGAAPRAGEAPPNSAASWSRTVPEGRRFPRGG